LFFLSLGLPHIAHCGTFNSETAQFAKAVQQFHFLMGGYFLGRKINSQDTVGSLVYSEGDTYY
jgi:hypothetical protein